MIKWTLIVCFGNNTWVMDTVEHPNHIFEEDVHQSYLQGYTKDFGEKGIKGYTDVFYIGTYKTETIDDE